MLLRIGGIRIDYLGHAHQVSFLQKRKRGQVSFLQRIPRFFAASSGLSRRQKET
jgi:hypothetical protein